MKGLKIKSSDLIMFANTHAWAAHPNLTRSMREHVFRIPSKQFNKTAPVGHFFGSANFFEKLHLAARVVCGIARASEVLAVASAPNSQRAVTRLANVLGIRALTGKFVPGTLTNKNVKQFVETRLLIVADPCVDTQALNEAKKENIPVIALCDSDASTEFVDVVVPCNNKGPRAVALAFFMLARNVLRMKRKISPTERWRKNFGFFLNITDSDLERYSKERGAVETKEEN